MTEGRLAQPEDPGPSDDAITDAVSAEGASAPGDPQQDLASEAVRRARASTRAVPPGRPQTSPRRGGSAQYGGRDPATVEAVLDAWIRSEGYQHQAREAGLTVRWADIAGPDVAAHARPEGLSITDSGPELLLRADSTAWATQLRVLSATLLERIREELGPDSVARIRILGPAPPRRAPGSRRVPGPGPRDTYG